jgi:dynamin 1-like protein
MKVETVKKLVASYFNVVRKQLIDQVPKTVMAYLVKGVLQDLQTELVRIF